MGFARSKGEHGDFYYLHQDWKDHLRALRALREDNNGTPLGGPTYLTSHGVLRS